MKLLRQLQLIRRLGYCARFLSANGEVLQESTCSKSKFVFHICNENADSHTEETRNFQHSFLENFTLIADFINRDEEEALLSEVQKGLQRLKYEFDHWDGVIYGYRELEKSRWGPKCGNVLDRVRSHAFDDSAIMLPAVHVLDLSKEGYIKPHVDSKFCGNHIAGLSLISSAIMRLKPKDCADYSMFVDVLLNPRSLYIMRNFSRYELTHEILPDESSCFRNLKICRDRRISIVMREEPSS